MAKNFEDLEAWKLARFLCARVHAAIGATPLNRDFTLIDQMKRSSGSVMDNIAEGFERGGNKEFIYFLSVAKGSCGELRSQLYRALDLQYISSETFSELHALSIQMSSQLQGFIQYLKRSNFKGSKFIE